MKRMKSLLLTIAVMAIAMAAFASSALAEEGVLKDTNGTVIPNGTTVNLKGWVKFETLGTGIECHATSAFQATGSEGKTGNVTAVAPQTASCHGFGSIYNGCKVTTDTVSNLPYATKITITILIHITGQINIQIGLSNCVNTNVTFTNLFFEEGVTLRPLKTGTRIVTNTENHLGTTAAGGEAIAGYEIEGVGEAENNLGELGVEATGELEVIGSARCTYKIG